MIKRNSSKTTQRLSARRSRRAPHRGASTSDGRRAGSVVLLDVERDGEKDREFAVLLEEQQEGDVRFFVVAPCHCMPELLSFGDLWITPEENDCAVPLAVETWNTARILVDEIPAPRGALTGEAFGKVLAMREIWESGDGKTVPGMLTGPPPESDRLRENFRRRESRALEHFDKRTWNALSAQRSENALDTTEHGVGIVLSDWLWDSFSFARRGPEKTVRAGDLNGEMTLLEIAPDGKRGGADVRLLCAEGVYYFHVRSSDETGRITYNFGKGKKQPLPEEEALPAHGRPLVVYVDGIKYARCRLSEPTKTRRREARALLKYSKIEVSDDGVVTLPMRLVLLAGTRTVAIDRYRCDRAELLETVSDLMSLRAVTADGVVEIQYDVPYEGGGRNTSGVNTYADAEEGARRVKGARAENLLAAADAEHLAINTVRCGSKVRLVTGAPGRGGVRGRSEPAHIIKFRPA